MPKEYVDSRWNEPSKNRFKIGWNKEVGHVQIATVNPEAEMLSNAEGTEVGAREGGWYVDLDRDGINRAIRMLRRARDDAFGKDE